MSDIQEFLRVIFQEQLENNEKINKEQLDIFYQFLTKYLTNENINSQTVALFELTAVAVALFMRDKTRSFVDYEELILSMASFHKGPSFNSLRLIGEEFNKQVLRKRELVT